MVFLELLTKQFTLNKLLGRLKLFYTLTHLKKSVSPDVWKEQRLAVDQMTPKKL